MTSGCGLLMMHPGVKRSLDRIFVFWGLLIGLFASSAANHAFAQSVDQVVPVVENHYQELRDLTAKVTQKNFLKAIDKTQIFEGMLWIKKPGKLRLKYTNGQLILIDGKAALFYSKNTEQVVKKTFTDIEQMNIPVAFLLGAAHIRDDFEAFQPEVKNPRLVELTPKKTSAAMRKLRIQTDEVGRIVRLIIFGITGNITEIEFTDLREDTGLDSKLFTFTAPKGTETIEQ